MASTTTPVPPSRAARIGRALRGWLAWLFRVRLCFGGLAGALVFFWWSLTPSLLPRDWLFQGAVSGILAAIGYGIGSAISALWRWSPAPEPSARFKRIGWWTLASLAVAGTAVMLWRAYRWQQEIRRLMEIADEPAFSIVGIFAVGLLLAVIFLVGARLVRSAARFLIRQVLRVVPPRIAQVVGILVLIVLLVGVVQGFVLRAAVDALNAGAGLTNGTTDPGTYRPTVPERSGSPASLVHWEDLGRQGREFIGRGPTVKQLEDFHGAGCCPQPIRVYVGLDSADSAATRAALAVRELERTGAFDRQFVAVFTATGTGWINPRVSSSFEYIHAGDTAEVSMQYSFLPSWISFLVDQEKAKEAGTELIHAVVHHVEQMPAAKRPKVVLYGESLGSFGTEQAFTGIRDLRDHVDGALLVGPTFSNPIWRHLTDERDPGTPEWLPTVSKAPGVHFARTPADLRGVADGTDSPRVVYLQNASDPITWWDVPLAYSKPDWAGSPRAPDRSPAFRWIPGVTFVQVGVDLADSLGVPAGHGHYFGTNVVDGWVAIDRPEGWTAADTSRLRAVLARR